MVPEKLMTLLPNEVTCRLRGAQLRLKLGSTSTKASQAELFQCCFLDTDFDVNTPQDREISFYLYGGNERYRLKQEAILGFGGVRMLDALGFSVRKYHMNEGHSSFLAVELMRKYAMDEEKVKELCVFTTHTPVEAGHDKFNYDLIT